MNTISATISHKEIIAGKSAVRAILIASFVMATALGAYVRIPLPFTPVPITLQTFFVVLCGAVLGKRLGVFAQFSYVALGALGMPIFQGYGAGFSHLLSPTGGYLAGFILAAFLTGALLGAKTRPSEFSYIMFAMLAGISCIYACGIAWLMAGYKFSFAKSVSLGLIPFMPAEAAKLAAASWIYSKIESRTSALLDK